MKYFDIGGSGGGLVPPHLERGEEEGEGRGREEGEGMGTDCTSFYHVHPSYISHPPTNAHQPDATSGGEPESEIPTCGLT
jgi:hypothetical protein